ncbi:MAG: SRPBCC domain-containing protein [Dehalococcoidia bacterium]
MEQRLMGEIIDGDTLRFVRTVAHSPERVWRAISDEQELRAWMRYPVRFEARAGGPVQFFGAGEIAGRVFICDAPRTLAYSFWDEKAPDAAEKVALGWHVRWDLEPVAEGCRVTFRHRGLGGAHLWGLDEGWHGFVDQLGAFLDGTLDALLAQRERRGGVEDTAGLTLYRAHASRSLLAWGEAAAQEARGAVASGEQEAAVAAVGRLGVAVRQLYEIARQDGPRPDYAPDPPPAPEGF